ncbi:MAG: PAS domain S-box protein [Salinivirgaceae bacterium]|nr:PAS domain S-box protein [Salinivirgaceae bacterium]
MKTKPTYQELENQIAELKKQNEKLINIFNYMTDVVWSISWPDLTHHYFSSALGKLYGRPVQEFMDNPLLFKEVTHPDDQHLTEKAMKQLVEEGEAERECRIIKPDGSIVWVNDRSKMIYDENHQPIRVEGVTRDITERKQAKENLVKEKIFSEKIMETADAIIVGLDKDHIIRIFNHGAEKISKYKKEEVIGKDWFKMFFPKEMLGEMNKVWKNAWGIKTHSYINSILTKSGEEIFISWQTTGMYDSADVSKHLLLSIGENITERKQAEEALIYEKDKAQQYLNIAGTMLLALDTNACVTLINQKGCDIVGDAEADILGLNFFDKYLSKDIVDIVKDLFKKTLTGELEFVKNYENPIINSYGEERIISWNSTLFYDDKQNIIGMLNSGEDITERKQAEEELIKVKEKAEESDHLKSAFLANMSHEIRTPMNAILGFSSLLKKKNISEEKKDKYLEHIEIGGNRLLHLISDIVDVSKMDANQLSLNQEACNVNKLIDNLQEQFKVGVTKCDIITTKGLSDAKSNITTDSTRLSQILSNLIENALKFTKKGDIEFGYTLKEKMLEFYVKDSGIGLNKKDHTIIFDRFTQVDNDYTRSGSGTGLGLAIVKSLTKLLGGEVWVESEKGEGATFYFTIPYTSTEYKTGEASETTSGLDLSKETTILIAEDESSNFMYLEALLEEFQCKILHAKNGKEAIELLENNDAIDLILMDIKMPVMNGLKATMKIRETNKAIPIIALTAYAMADDKQKALDAGCNDYLEKPLSEDKLAEIIGKYIKKGANTRYRS